MINGGFNIERCRMTTDSCFSVCRFWFLQPGVSSSRRIHPTLCPPVTLFDNFIPKQTSELHGSCSPSSLRRETPVINLILQQPIWLVDIASVGGDQRRLFFLGVIYQTLYTAQQIGTFFSATQDVTVNKSPEVTWGHLRLPEVTWSPLTGGSQAKRAWGRLAEVVK